MNLPPLQDIGMPQDRLARLAARRAFVELKHDFMIASAGLPGHRGDWLRERVRKAEDPYTLWQLRHSLFAALEGNDPDTCTIRHALKTGLDTLFCESDAGLPSTQDMPLQSTSPGVLPAHLAAHMNAHMPARMPSASKARVADLASA